MKTIGLKELKNLPPDEAIVVDVRKPEDFRGGSFGNAINLPMEEFEGRIGEIPKGKPVYLLCYTGRQSISLAERLQEEGYDAACVDGGYRSLLRLSLEEALQEEEALGEWAAQMERSLIKKFRKPIWRKFTKAVRDYALIQEGDKVAACISGGKDSMVMAKLLQELQKHGQVKFDLVFLAMDPGYHEDNWKIVQENARLLGIPLTAFQTDIFDIVADVKDSPCYLCARMRRGYLYSHAKELGCNKIALGHHFDDVVETILMGMLYSGKVETMMPKLHSKNFEGMELIRPLYLVKEEDIKAWRDYNGLHFIQCACHFTESCAACVGSKSSKRDQVKALVGQLRKESSIIEKNIFNSVTNINLQTVIGYHKNDWSYHFLQDYEERGRQKKEES